MKQSVCAVLDTLAPGQSDKIWPTLRSNMSYEEEEMVIDESGSERSQCEKELIEALVESYNNASHWSTRRQILSIMADKMPLKELKHYIPGLTRYRFSMARHHKLLHGRGVVPSVDVVRRLKVDYTQLDHFLKFITSSHIVQDMLFGEKMLKLSTGEIIKTPNSAIFPALRRGKVHSNEQAHVTAYS